MDNFCWVCVVGGWGWGGGGGGLEKHTLTLLYCIVLLQKHSIGENDLNANIAQDNASANLPSPPVHNPIVFMTTSSAKKVLLLALLLLLSRGRP